MALCYISFFSLMFPNKPQSLGSGQPPLSQHSLFSHWSRAHRRWSPIFINKAWHMIQIISEEDQEYAPTVRHQAWYVWPKACQQGGVEKGAQGLVTTKSEEISLMRISSKQVIYSYQALIIQLEAFATNLSIPLHWSVYSMSGPGNQKWIKHFSCLAEAHKLLKIFQKQNCKYDRDKNKLLNK